MFNAILNATARLGTATKKDWRDKVRSDLSGSKYSFIDTPDVKLDASIAQLDDKRRCMILLHRMYGFSYAKIARIVAETRGSSCSDTTVRTWYINAIHKLRNQLKMTADVEIRDAHILKLGLPTRARVALLCEDIETICQLCEYTEDELLQIHYIGQKSVRQIKEGLAKYGCALKEVK